MGYGKDECTRIPDYPDNHFPFKPVCQMHDYGYALIKAKVLPQSAKPVVDFWFHAVLYVGVCNTYRGWRAAEGVVCRRYADVYYVEVRTFGDPRS